MSFRPRALPPRRLRTATQRIDPVCSEALMATRAALGAVLLISAVLPRSTVRAGWEPDGNPICGAASTQRGTVAVSDGDGGAFIAWVDVRSGTGDIYMQRVDGAGTALWATDGVAVCAAASWQDWPSLLPDGAGGVIVAWSDYRDGATSHYDIYAQRVDSAGAPSWTPNGVAVCKAARGQFYAKMTSNGAGGAIVVWDDDRASNSDVYAARLTAAGATPDGLNGIPISTGTAVQGTPALTPYGNGGAIIAWSDTRNGGNGGSDIYAARLSSSGAVLDPLGIAICLTQQDQFAPRLIGDGAEGAIIAWSDGRAEAVYAQRLSSAGTVHWTPNGVAVGGGGTGAVFSPPGIVPDGAGGALISWFDYDGVDYNIYAQRINAAGARQWLPNDLKVCDESSEQRVPVSASDEAGGAIIAWEDKRAGGPGYDIYAQRVLPTGAVAWTPNGASVCQAILNQTDLAVVTDGAGGAIFAWQDQRTFMNSDIYAMRLDPGGQTPTSVADVPSVAFTVLPARPNPFSGTADVEVRLTKPADLVIDVFDIAGRRVRAFRRPAMPAGEQRIVFDGRDEAGHRLPSGVYLCRVGTGGTHGASSTQKLVLVR